MVLADRKLFCLEDQWLFKCSSDMFYIPIDTCFYIFVINMYISPGRCQTNLFSE